MKRSVVAWNRTWILEIVRRLRLVVAAVRDTFSKCHNTSDESAPSVATRTQNCGNDEPDDPDEAAENSRKE